MSQLLAAMRDERFMRTRPTQPVGRVLYLVEDNVGKVLTATEDQNMANLFAASILDDLPEGSSVKIRIVKGSFFAE